jgi:hypothetical protein
MLPDPGFEARSMAALAYPRVAGFLLVSRLPFLRFSAVA